MGNQVPPPTLRQLNRTINTPNVYADHGENHRTEKRNRAGQRLQETAAHTPANEIGCAKDEDGDGEQLEDDAGDHGVCAWRGVTADFVHFAGGHAAADSLDHQRDDIAGAEDPEVQAGFEDG